jgi:hypothetical protein
MNQSSSTLLDDHGAYWADLQRAIAHTSGFRRWVIEQNISDTEQVDGLERLVSLYLRQTLETLAY